MPRLLAVGHVTWDHLQGQHVLGGSVSYATLAARKLGWEAAALTSAGRGLRSRARPARRDHVSAPAPGPPRASSTTTGPGGARTAGPLRARRTSIDSRPAARGVARPRRAAAGRRGGGDPAAQRAGLPGRGGGGQRAGLAARVRPRRRRHPLEWKDPAASLAGVHALFLSEHDIPGARAARRDLLSFVPVIALTSGWRGLYLVTRDGERADPRLPAQEVDPTGAGDVFATTFLIRYQETGNPAEAAVFASCGASCVVEGVATTTLGDRAEIQRRARTCATA